MIFNKLMFVHRHHHSRDEAADVAVNSDGAAGVRVPG
jgi:hypothetical protein